MKKDKSYDDFKLAACVNNLLLKSKDTCTFRSL